MKTICLSLTLLLFAALSCFGQEDIQNHFAAAIKDDLLEMDAQQKFDSKNLYIVTIECGNNSKEAAMGRRISRKNDSIARLKVESIVHVYGYPGPKVIGERANKILFDIIYNMDFQMAKKYVAILREALNMGNVSPEDYAALADKVSVEETNAQIYGTITQIKGGRLYMPPIKNPGGVDSVRQQIGLPPLKRK